MIRRVLLFFLVFLISIFCLMSCTDHELTLCRDVLEAITAEESKLPKGKTYDLSAKEGDSAYLPERLINSLFGDGEALPQRSGWLDAALYLSTGDKAFELAVILCSSPDNAKDTARLLIGRLDTLRSAFPDGENAEYVCNASVTVIKNYALLIMSRDTENAVKTASDTIRAGA